MSGEPMYSWCGVINPHSYHLIGPLAQRMTAPRITEGGWRNWQRTVKPDNALLQRASGSSGGCTFESCPVHKQGSTE